jgi:hypothetical protein
MGLNPEKHRIIGLDYERTQLDLERVRKKLVASFSTSGCIGVLAGFEPMSTKVMSTKVMSTEVMSTDERLLFAGVRGVLKPKPF